MFDRVAPRYDIMNHLLSVGMDVRWRKLAANALDDLDAGQSTLKVLDLCAGTGDQSTAIAERGHRVTALDFSPAMVRRAADKHRRAGRKISSIVGDALCLPYSDTSFDAVTVSFGLRNVADLDRALKEVVRVLRPGGRLLALEFALPTQPLLRRLYLLYFRHLLPLIGRKFSSSRKAYTYLRDSVLAFPERDELSAKMKSVGFDESSWTDLSAGTVCLYRAAREPAMAAADRPAHAA